MINKIAVIGVGLIGGSLALACKKNSLATKIVGCSRKLETLNRAKELFIIDDGSVEISKVVVDADVVVICTPLGTYKDIARQISPYLRDDVIITDVGSVKDRPSGDIFEGLDKKFHARFVPAHPIAGTEKSGPDAAFAELYENKKVFLTPFKFTDAAAVEKVKALWNEVGANVELMDSDRHDFIYATVSHLIQFLSYSYGAALCALDSRIVNDINRHKDINYQKFMRLAGSDPAMWRDIFIINKEYLFCALKLFEQNLQLFYGQIEMGLESVIHNRLIKSKNKRLLFHKLLKGGDEYDKFRPSHYGSSDEQTRVWLDMLPRVIAAMVMETITESEYEFATGAGLHSLSKKIISEGATDSDDLFAHKETLLGAIGHFLLEIDNIRNIIAAEDCDAMTDIFKLSQSAYDKLMN